MARRTLRGSVPAPDPASRRTVVAGAIGNVLEWYDFAIYGIVAATIGRQFFPRANELPDRRLRRVAAAYMAAAAVALAVVLYLKETAKRPLA